MSITAMSEANASKRIANMVKFIESESLENIETINAKADEEFYVEKQRLLADDRNRLNEIFEKKIKHVELLKKIQASNMINQSKLSVLKAKEDHIKYLLDDARGRLGTITQDKNRYAALLTDLITQALCQLLEPEVIIRCRKQDADIVRSVADTAAKQYKATANKDIRWTIDTKTYLGNDVSGGIVLLTKNGLIKCNNTLESRLEMMSAQMIPEIRQILFGSNPHRKYFD